MLVNALGILHSRNRTPATRAEVDPVGGPERHRREIPGSPNPTTPPDPSATASNTEVRRTSHTKVGTPAPARPAVSRTPRQAVAAPRARETRVPRIPVPAAHNKADPRDRRRLALCPRT